MYNNISEFINICILLRRMFWEEILMPFLGIHINQEPEEKVVNMHRNRCFLPFASYVYTWITMCDCIFSPLMKDKCVIPWLEQSG